MKALVLAAGRGGEVQPASCRVPKAMLPVFNRPVLELIVDLLRSHGVREIMISTSYLAGEMESYFRDGSRFGVEIGYSFEGHLSHGRIVDQHLGSAGAIRRIQDHSKFFDEPFFVLNPDAITDLDLKALTDFHREHRAIATVAAAKVASGDVNERGAIAAEPGGRIRAIDAKAPTERLLSLANTGMYLFEPDLIDLIPRGAAYDIETDLLPLLTAGNLPFYAFTEPFQWLGLGSPAQYHSLLCRAMTGSLPGFRAPGREIAPGIRVGRNVSFHPESCSLRPPVWIGSSTTVGDGASLLGPCYVGPGSIVDSGAHVEKSFVFDYTHVGRLAHLCRALASGRYCSTTNGVSIDTGEADLGWVLSDARGPASSAPELERLLEELLAR